MKIKKKTLLVLFGLLLIFFLIGCSTSNSDQEDLDIDNEKTPAENIQEDEVTEDLDTSYEDSEADSSDDVIDEMIESSDYITKIKLITKGKDAIEIKILENIKGRLAVKDLPPLDNLKNNASYVVFLKDLDDSIILSDQKNGIILLEGDNHKLFEKINKQ